MFRNVWLVGGFLLTLVLTGCSQSSLFKSLSQNSRGVDTAQEYLNNGSYQDAISVASAIATDTTQSDQQRSDAYAVWGQSIMGSYQVTAVDLIASIGEKSSMGPQNILLLMPTLSKEASIEAANALNTASQFNAHLSSNAQLSRALANALVLSTLLQDKWVITDAGVTATQGFATTLPALFTPVSGTKTIVDYSDALLEALSQSGLGGVQQTDLTKIQVAIQGLKTVSQSGETNEGTLKNSIDSIIGQVK